jgi:hypothetical protein
MHWNIATKLGSEFGKSHMSVTNLIHKLNVEMSKLDDLHLMDCDKAIIPNDLF